MNLRRALLWTIDSMFAVCVVVGGACVTMRGMLVPEVRGSIRPKPVRPAERPN